MRRDECTPETITITPAIHTDVNITFGHYRSGLESSAIIATDILTHTRGGSQQIGSRAQAGMTARRRTSIQLVV